MFLVGRYTSGQTYFDIAGVSQTVLHSLTSNSKPEVPLNSIEAFIQIPVVNTDHTKLLINPSFEYIELNYIDSADGFRKLQSQSIACTYIKKLSHWKVAVSYISRYSGGLKDITLRQLYHGTAGIVSYAFSDQFETGVGYLFLKDGLKDLSYPMISLNWRAHERLNLYVVLPRFVLVEYKCNPSLYIGLRSSFVALSYSNQQKALTYVRDSRIRGFADLSVYKNIWLTIDLGLALMRDGYDERLLAPLTYQHWDLSDALLFKSGLVYRKRLK